MGQFTLLALALTIYFVNSINGDNVTPILDLSKCAGLGLNLTQADYATIVGSFNYTNINLNTPQMIAASGLPVESHYVTTADGYILNLFRIPNPNATNGVVFIQHGLLASSDFWFLNYYDKNLPYILANAGYDVWLGNSRGNVYSRNHTTLDPNQLLGKFWDFSWHEMGIYDVPANIDYILGITNKRNLIYIGHSQGTTQYFAGITTLPSYNSKIRIMVALAPPEFMNGTYSIIRALANAEVPGPTDTLACAIGSDGTGAFGSSAQDAVLNAILPVGCSTQVTVNLVCNSAVFLVMGYDYYQSQNELVPSIANHFPQGSAMKSLVHYGQLMNNNNFQQFDYGPGTNRLLSLLVGLISNVTSDVLPFLQANLGLNLTTLSKWGIPTLGSSTVLPTWLINVIIGGNKYMYGSSVPPKYNLSLATAPVVIYAGPNDALAAESGVAILAPKVAGNIDLAKSPPFRVVPYECFNHADFTGIARDINPLLYDGLMGEISKY